MSKTATPAPAPKPAPAPAPAPDPVQGGRYLRQPDGSLTPAP